MKNIYPLSRKANIVVQELNGEVLIYDLSENKAFCLNEISASIWNLCDGTKSISEIAQAISKDQNQIVNDDLVWLALDQFKKEHLIENEEEVIPNFDGISRREVIRKIGFATMVALPIVTAVVAPTAANAASGGCPNPVGGTTINGACTSSCQCNQFGNPPGFIRCCQTTPPGVGPFTCVGAGFNCITP